MNEKILYVRLPCNPIFPIGVVYLSDHIHKLFPEIEQKIFDLGTIPPLDFNSALDRCIDEFQPTLLIFSCPIWLEFISISYHGDTSKAGSSEILFRRRAV